MNGWITLLSSENYLPAVLILNQTMQNVKSKYPLIVGITEDIYSDKIITILHKYNIITEKIEKTSYAKEVVEKYSNHSVLNTASKIMLFSLDKYEKLIYIDADVYVKENMDELFDNYEDGSILCYPYDKEDNKQLGMSALFVFRPKNHFYKRYLIAMNALESFDGDFIGKMWFHIRSNPQFQIPHYYMGYPENTTYCKSVHLINQENKYWLIPEPIFKTNQIERDCYKLLQQFKEEAQWM